MSASKPVNLPCDVVLLFLMQLSLVHLLNVARTSMVARDLVCHELRARHRRMLRRFVSDPDRFLAVLEECEAIISGSFALNYAIGIAAWAATDLDLYVSPMFYRELVAYFVERENYSVYVRPEATKMKLTGVEKRARMIMTGIKQVISLVKGENKIDIIVTMSISPVSTVTRFWSTLQMNYMTAQGFCSLYPTLTFDGIGLMSSSALCTRAAVPRSPILRLLTKYENRGFRFFTRGEAILHEDTGRGPTEISHRTRPDDGFTFQCHEYRGIQDGRSFTITFGTKEIPYTVGASLHKSRWRVGWRLGGMWGTRCYRYRGAVFDYLTGEVDRPGKYFDDMDFDEDEYIPHGEE